MTAVSAVAIHNITGSHLASRADKQAHRRAFRSRQNPSATSAADAAMKYQRYGSIFAAATAPPTPSMR